MLKGCALGRNPLVLEQDNNEGNIMNRYDVRVGEVYTFVHAKAGGRFAVKVKRVNPKNIKAVTASGKAWNVHPSFLRDDASDAEREAFTSAAPAAGAAASARLVTGQVVRFRDGREGNVPFVVIGRHGETFRLTKLGGDGGKYWPGVMPEQVEVLNINLSLEEV